MSYNQYGYQQPSYMGTNYQGYQRQPIIQNMPFQPQPQAQTQMPNFPQIQDLRYGTEEEARAFIVYPNASAYFIDEPKGRLYVKTANNMGASSMNYFALTPINADGSPIKPQEPTPQVDMGEYLKKSDLAQFGFVTIDQLDNAIKKLTSQQNQPMGVKPNGTGTNSKSQM